MRARVIVTLKSGVLDPQGKAIGGALASLGVNGIASVRQGKVFDVELIGDDAEAARAALRTACEKLLANTVIENYRVEIEGAEGSGKRRGGSGRREAEAAARHAAEESGMPAEGHP